MKTENVLLEIGALDPPCVPTTNRPSFKKIFKKYLFIYLCSSAEFLSTTQV